jgi:cytoplasmic iron level regulating protein YaaA (DUF328/UPF0246 family)
VLIVLPPSETKRYGGHKGAALDLGSLGFPELQQPREVTLAALIAVSHSSSESRAALRLGATQSDEVLRNRVVRSSALLPAIERYTGVLYDGLEVTSLAAEERAFADEHVVIHSALFGLIRAGDRIPAYRLSQDSRLPGLSLRTHWKEPIGRVFQESTGLIVDLRSESYVRLGPAPRASYVRVVSEGVGGRRVALSHFNKKAKGQFTRALIGAQIDHPSVDSLLAWAIQQRIRLEPVESGELDLIV